MTKVIWIASLTFSMSRRIRYSKIRCRVQQKVDLYCRDHHWTRMLIYLPWSRETTQQKSNLAQEFSILIQNSKPKQISKLLMKSWIERNKSKSQLCQVIRNKREIILWGHRYKELMKDSEVDELWKEGRSELDHSKILEERKKRLNRATTVPT